MPYFSDYSEKELSKCREELQRPLRATVEFMQFELKDGSKFEIKVTVDNNDIYSYYLLAGRILQSANLMGIGIEWDGNNLFKLKKER